MPKNWSSGKINIDRKVLKGGFNFLVNKLSLFHIYHKYFFEQFYMT